MGHWDLMIFITNTTSILVVFEITFSGALECGRVNVVEPLFKEKNREYPPSLPPKKRLVA